MINKKGIVLISAAVALLLGITGCNTGKDESVSNAGEAIVTGGAMSAIKAEGFNNISELKKNAEEIVHLKILSTETVEDQELFFTYSKAEILNVIKGNLAKGDIIKLIQTGAIIDGQDISIMGDPIYRLNDEAVLFLKKGKDSTGEYIYRSLGISDGRFDVINSKIIARGLGYGDESMSKEKGKLKKSDSIAEMSFSDITGLDFTVEEFIQKIEGVKE
ncbi:hypothetical protein [Acetivibrio mesophilus]|uniref:Uncharacterized protein n=1 Tax=Acetivibrio mesophilus TaxID=2487273 RepID=A0A4Q0I394_9FIRM|nr:hypothetical protein [Acetivibrio mesophilus]RXE58730.1 hypothetical protein EFD62_10515 [Acetivibrio mesophilus]